MSADVMLALVHALLDCNATTAAAIVSRQGVATLACWRFWSFGVGDSPRLGVGKEWTSRGISWRRFASKPLHKRRHLKAGNGDGRDWP